MKAEFEPTAMTMPGSEEPLVSPELEKRIIDAICAARDADVKREFEQYGSVIIEPSQYLRAKSHAVAEVFGPDVKTFGSTERGIVDRVYDIARAEGKLWTRLIV